MLSMRLGIVVTLILWSAGPSLWSQPPNVRPERPRLFWRAKAWEGPSVEKVRQWMQQSEHKALAERTSGDPVGNAALYLLTGDAAAGQKALAALKEYKIDGLTPTYSGLSALRMGVLYDWLHDHPNFDAVNRKAAIAELENWGNTFARYLAQPNVDTPFYSRMAGATAGLTAIGLALRGDSPKAEVFIALVEEVLKEHIGTVRQVEDGASGSGTYAYHHSFPDLANIAAMWRSSSDWDAADWIAKDQGNWLERQLLFRIWMTYPNGWYVKDGDIGAGQYTDRAGICVDVPVITSLYRNGVGQSFCQETLKRMRPADLDERFAWEWLLFNDPTIPAKPLSSLGRADVFGPKLHGYVCWRSGWGPDATIIHFRCGDTVDRHATRDQGKFIIFKGVPLAIKNGSYASGWATPHHNYYRSPWSSNCVVFTGPRSGGMQPNVDINGATSWKVWKIRRDAIDQPPTGVLLVTEANERSARAVGDLTGSTGGEAAWLRELVFLDYKYLIVLDRVRVLEGVQHRWTLHTVNEPTVEGGLAVADNPPGRLFCRTLLPADAKLEKVGGPMREYDFNGVNRALVAAVGEPEIKICPEMQLGAWRLDVRPSQPGAECTYLHVLFPTDDQTEGLPDCSVRQSPGELTVTVGRLSHVFKL